MNFKYSDDDEAFRIDLRSWLEHNAPAEVRSMPESAGSDEEDWRQRVAWHRKLYEGGWIAIEWPKEHGGRESDLVKRIIYNEEFERAGLRAPALGLGIALTGPALIRFGSPKQKARHLPKILSGDEIWCQGLSEPAAGSDLGGLGTTAQQVGDSFVVNGKKTWVSSAQRADMMMLLARTGDETSFLIVDLHSPGISVRPMVQITGTAEACDVSFENVQVPRQNLLGALGQGREIARTPLGLERTLIGLRDLTPMVRQMASLATAIADQNGSAWDNGAVRQRIAGFAVEAAALKYTGLRQITRRLKGLAPGPESSIMKLATTELNLRMQEFVMELMGPYGQLEYKSPYAPERGVWSQRMLSARAGTIGGGSSQVQRNIIGERVLGLPRD